MDARLEEKLDALPTEPGVYLMKDRRGRGHLRRQGGEPAQPRALATSTAPATRAPSSRSRPAPRRHRDGARQQREGGAAPRERADQAAPAALQRPAQDDKNFICLRLDEPQAVPAAGGGAAHPAGRRALLRARTPARASIRETLRIINRYFQLRTCTDHVLHNRKRPCLLLPDRPLPGAVRLPRARARSTPQRGRGGAVPRGQGERAGRRACKRAHEAAPPGAAVRGGRAAARSALRHRAQPGAPEGRHHRLHRSGRVRLLPRGRTGSCSTCSTCAQGRLTGGQAFPFSGQEFPDEELLASFVNLYYDERNFVPEEVLLPLEPEGAGGAGGAAHRAARASGCGCCVPQRGEKRDLVEHGAQERRAGLRGAQAHQGRDGRRC